MEDNNLIKFAYYLEDWDFEKGDKKALRKEAEEIATTEYLPEMKGHIFCPECSAPLFKSPENKEFDTNGRKAFLLTGVSTDLIVI